MIMMMMMMIIIIIIIIIIVIMIIITIWHPAGNNYVSWACEALFSLG